jgi:Tfp pilus assembly protein PilF
LADIDRALSLDPDSAYVHNVKADILAALGRRNEAIAEYKKALAIAPDLQESVQGLKALQRSKP